MSRRLGVLVAVLAGLVVVGAAVATYLLNSHRAPSTFSLSGSPAAAPSSGLAGKWTVTGGSEVGYRVREQFINQPSPTEAVARTSSVTGSIQIASAGSTYKVTTIAFSANLSTLVSQDKYATFQTYQRDFFIRTIYLETDQYPKAEFRAGALDVATNLAPGPATLDVTGSLTVHGVTKAVTTHPQVQLLGSQIEVAGSISVDMRDYNIGPPDISFTKAEPGVLIEYHLLLARG